MVTFVAARRSRAGRLASRAPAGGPSRSSSLRADQDMVRKILRGAHLQAKLTVGAPHDVYEQEADQVAETVMRMPEPLIQPKPS